jgi:MscS family membrane protein
MLAKYLKVFFIILLSVILLGFNAYAEISETGDNSTETAPPVATKPIPPPENLSSPHKTLITFLEAMRNVHTEKNVDRSLKKAISTLDLSQITPLVRDTKGKEAAWILADVLSREHWFNAQRFKKLIKAVPNTTAHKLNHYVLYANASKPTDQNQQIILSKQANGRWLFSADTIENLESILNILIAKSLADESHDDKVPLQNTIQSNLNLPLYLRIQQRIPESLKVKIFDLYYWQWLGLLLVIILGLLADKIVSWLLNVMVRVARNVAGGLYKSTSKNILRPFGLMAMAGIWWEGLDLLVLPAVILAILLVAAKFLAALSGVWGMYRLVDLLTLYLQAKAAKTLSTLDDMLVPLFNRIAKLFVSVIGIVFIAGVMQMNIAGLLAGLGLGGLAFALAAKDVVENLFGYLTVVADRPFIVGDWVIINGIEGTIESIGFRSTRIRTFHNSQVSLPNSQLLTSAVDNMGRRRYRRFKTYIALTYDTPPEKIEAFCEAVRNIVMKHPLTRKDYFQVYFNNCGSTSLDILVYIFFDTLDWGAELKGRHDFLLDVMRLGKVLDIEFAFPTQTVYVRNDDKTPMPDYTDKPPF